MVEPVGQGWLQVGELGLALLLSALIGAEREVRHKSAGLRTHTLVGLAAALIMLVSKYGFTNVLDTGRVVLDPSRVAAQVVSGIGFIGGGVIFVRQDLVRGLTTASIVWLTAAVGMACGAGLPVLAVAATAGHFVVVFAFPPLMRHLPASRFTPSVLRISYLDGKGLLRDILVACTRDHFTIGRVRVERAAAHADDGAPDVLAGAVVGTLPSPTVPRVVTVVLEVRGIGSVLRLASRLSEIGGVISVSTAGADASAE